MQHMHFFSALSDTIVSFAVGGGYIALFILMFLEAIPLLGIAIPGHVAIISAGFLVGTGVLSLGWVFIIGIAGAALGDFVSYLLGLYAGWPLIERLRPFFFVPQSVIVRARAVLAKHSGKALVLGRFNPVTRGLMPFFVGANKTHAKHFWIWNMVGTVLWIGSSIVIGYALSLGLSAVAGWTSKALVIALVAAVLIAWSYKFVNLRFHVFKRYELFVLGLNIASLLIFFRMIEDVYSPQPFLASFDLAVNGFMNGLVERAGSWVVSVAAWISALGGTEMLIFLTVAGAIAYASRKKWRSATIMLLSVGSAGFITGVLKDIVGRYRPENLLTPHLGGPLSFLFDNASTFSEPSFPSGHATIAAAFFVVVVYLLVRKMRGWVGRELVILGGVLLTLAIGLSRLVLSVHWASDVIAGWSVGVFCATASILFVRYLSALMVKRMVE